MSGGLTARRLILQQITAVAQHSPFKSSFAVFMLNNPPNTNTSNNSNNNYYYSRLSSFLIRPERNRGTFTLMTEEEMEYLRRRRDEKGEEGRIVLSTRPTKNIFRGIAGSGLNVLLSFLLSPILALSVSLEAVRLRGVRLSTFILAPMIGLTWGAVFIFISWYAAGQQLFLSIFYQLQYPVRYICCTGSCWSELTCSYEYPSGVLGHTHPLLHLYPSDVKLRERAMRREARRKRKEKRDVKYEGNNNNNNDSDSDYYKTLGVERDATSRQIREAFNRLVLEVHPDKNPNKSAATQFDNITKAYRVLNNAEKRRKYDIAGNSAVENIGEKKREAVRALFGGNTLFTFVGDVKTGSFSQRVIDGLDWTQEEIAVCRQRMLERCRDELLTSYIQPLQKTNNNNNNNNNNNSAINELAALKHRLQQLLHTGLAKEVLHTVGEEYLRVLHYSSLTNPIQRFHFLIKVKIPHDIHRRLDKYRSLTQIRKNTFQDSAAMVDLAWFTSVEEIENTARWVAIGIILDPKLSKEEKEERRQALRQLAETFITYGHPYKGANRQTMDTLMNSLREYQQKQQQAKQNE